MSILTRAVLAFEALVILLALPVATHVNHQGVSAVWLLAGLAVAAVISAGMVRRPGGLILGSGLQVAILAAGLVAPALAVIGALFAALWVIALVVGRRGEALRAFRLAKVTSDHPNNRSGAVVAERTLVLIKPDGVARNLVGEVLGRIERKGWRIVALELRTLDRATAEAHYGEHSSKPFFGELVDFITSSPLVAAVVEGPDVIVGWRNLMGATNPVNATPGTIRGDLAATMGENVSHGSDSPESAAKEIALFFPGLA